MSDYRRYFDENRANWDDRAVVHEAAGYGIERLIADRTALSATVEKDRARLGDLSGLEVIHLQCHLGTDTVSLARLGAARVVGLDFSAESIARGRSIARRCGAAVSYVTANVYDARTAVRGTFDVVYTSVGVLCWLPDVGRWAEVVASLLKPGGRFVIRDDHPFRATIDDDVSRGLMVEHPYFEADAPTTWSQAGSYIPVPDDAPPIASVTVHEWSHGLGEVVTALIRAGLTIDSVEELDDMAWCPWPAMMVEDEDGFALQ